VADGLAIVEKIGIDSDRHIGHQGQVHSVAWSGVDLRSACGPIDDDFGAKSPFGDVAEWGSEWVRGDATGTRIGIPEHVRWSTTERWACLAAKAVVRTDKTTSPDSVLAEAVVAVEVC
jgi:hypothetical protein